MLVTVEGIVLGKRDIGENNCFLDILTNEYGVIEVMAHGIRKANSKNAASSGLFSYSTFCLNKSNLRYTLNSTEPKFSFYGLSANLQKFSLAVYFADIIKYTSTAEQSGDDFLRFFAITLFELEKENSDHALIKAVFELRAASMLGFMPDLRACRSCGEYIKEKMFFSSDENDLICGDCAELSVNSTENIMELSDVLLHTLRFTIYTPIEKVYGFKLNGSVREQFSAFTEEYLLKHLGRTFKTLDYYKKTEENFYE